MATRSGSRPRHGKLTVTGSTIVIMYRDIGSVGKEERRIGLGSARAQEQLDCHVNESPFVQREGEDSPNRAALPNVTS